MSQLTIYSQEEPQQPLMVLNELSDIARKLAAINIRFERWEANKKISANADQAEIIAMYQDSIDRIMQEYNFGSVDVVHMTPNHPDKVPLRKKFLCEHVHSEDEVRFFVKGGGLFCLHVDEKIYAVNCQQRDFISVPTGIKHWFDAGEDPSFSVIRFFTHKEGWIAHYTGDTLAEKFPEYTPPPGTTDD